MNSKTAKKLRKKALEQTVGRPVATYAKRQFIESVAQPIVLMSGCTRYVYKWLKRQHNPHPVSPTRPLIGAFLA